MEYDSDETLNSILSELSKTNTVQKPATGELIKKPAEDVGIKSLESYILNNGSNTLSTTREVIGILLEQIQCNPDPELITSVAEMLNSNNRALETLTKIYLNDQKLKQAKELEQFKQSVKLQIVNTQIAAKQKTREEIMKEIIDAEIVEDDETPEKEEPDD